MKTQLSKALIKKGYTTERLCECSYQLLHNGKDCGTRNSIDKLIVMAWSRERDRYLNDRELFNLEKMGLL